MADETHVITTVTPEATSIVVTGGIPGERGEGVPPGGIPGQVLAKTGEGDFQTDWIAPLPAPDAFRVSNRFSELDTPQAKIQARVNLELQSIDCGEFL